ncbi:MAG: hypothetical protein A2020_03835 [Lentisphaerae bacterium GWF2_45_14]|nr:MAG: hypothetical protein A2020_03835 [Lentisphaerae bacterium GWF2_45_14]
MAIGFALCCFGFTAVNDLVFRLYARKSRSRGAYVMVIGVVWALLFTLLLDCKFTNLTVTLVWGSISGIFSAVANILLIEAMTYQESGICSTLYRLNMAIVAVGAFLLLGEPINGLKIIGIILALVAVCFFYRESRNGKSKVHDAAHIGIYLALGAALLRAAMGLSYKYAFIQHADRNGLITLNSFFWIVVGLAYMLCRERSLKFMEAKSIRYGIVSGLLVGGIIYFMALALQYGDASVVLPVAQMSFLGTCVLGVFFLRESMTVGKLIGISAGITSIIALILGSG